MNKTALPVICDLQKVLTNTALLDQSYSRWLSHRGCQMMAQSMLRRALALALLCGGWQRAGGQNSYAGSQTSLGLWYQMSDAVGSTTAAVRRTCL
jgi:hypothetical protein